MNENRQLPKLKKMGKNGETVVFVEQNYNTLA